MAGKGNSKVELPFVTRTGVQRAAELGLSEPSHKLMAECSRSEDAQAGKDAGRPARMSVGVLADRTFCLLLQKYAIQLR